MIRIIILTLFTCNILGISNYTKAEDPTFIIKKPVIQVIIDENLLKIYTKAESLICVYKVNEGDKAIEEVKKLGFKIDLRSNEGNFLICSWKGELKKEVLEALIKNPIIRNVEPNIEVRK